MVTSGATDDAGVGGRHGARPGVREKVAGRRENPSGKSSVVGVREGIREASGVAENSGGGGQIVGGGVKLPQVIDTPVVEELPRGNETYGMSTKGGGVPGEDRRVQGGDRNPPTTQETKAFGSSGSDKGMTSGPGLLAPSSPQRVTAADGDSAGTHHRHTNSADGARTERAIKYGLLALAEPAGDPASAGTQVSGDGHGATRGAEIQGHRATEMGYRTGQRALLARGMLEDNDRERRPPERQRVPTVLSQGL